MEQEELEVKGYIIPNNVSSKFEFFEGYGWKEVFIGLVFLALGGGIGYVLKFIFLSNWPFLITILFGVVGFFICIRDPHIGLSMLEYYLKSRKYGNKQNQLHYVFGKGRGQKEDVG